MDQSQLTSKQDEKPQFSPPPRTFTVEFLVGIFTIIGVACAAWLAIGLGGVQFFNTNTYDVYAQFDNVSGLKTGASVEIAGVPIGEVGLIALKDPVANVTLHLKNEYKLKDDDIASIRTKGIIGDRYVKISRGGSDVFIQPGGTVVETESVVDIEDLIGKIVHSFSNDKSEEGKEKEK